MKQVKIIGKIGEQIVLQSVKFNQWFVLSELEEFRDVLYSHKHLTQSGLDDIPASFTEMFAGYLITKVLDLTYRQKAFVLCSISGGPDVYYLVGTREMRDSFEQVGLYPPSL